MWAEILLKSSAIFDSINDEPFDGYIAIGGNKIIGIGKGKAGGDSFIGKNTKVYDFEDKLIIPGFHDNHIHVLLSGMYRSCVDLGSAKSEKQAAEMVRDFEASNPTEGWIFGFNWYNFFWKNTSLPTKFSLDEYFPDRPVLLINSECHGAWVNSKALEICGITKDTPDPDRGIIGRLENGEPSGVLDEAATDIVAIPAFNFSLERQLVYLQNVMKHASSLGVTSFVDVQPLFGVEMSLLEAMKYLEKKGELNFRAFIAGDLFKDLDAQEEKKQKNESDLIKLNYLKQFLEGIFPTHTCLLLEDYADAPGNKGIVVADLEKIRNCVMEAHKRGFSIKLHAQADRAIRLGLDYYQEAITTYGKGSVRHALEHCEIVNELDRKRFKELDVVPSMEPEHLGLLPHWENHEYRETLGDKRAWEAWPVKSTLDDAGVVALGSDCPVVDLNPFYQINRAITRILDDGTPEGGWNPKERLTLAEAIKGYTYGSAYSVGMEKELGTLKEGNLADITVVDRNLFNCEIASIREAKAELTIVNGRIVFSRDVAK